jgi:hypothetical protein
VDWWHVSGLESRRTPQFTAALPALTANLALELSRRRPVAAFDATDPAPLERFFRGQDQPHNVGRTKDGVELVRDCRTKDGVGEYDSANAGLYTCLRMTGSKSHRRRWIFLLRSENSGSHAACSESLCDSNPASLVRSYPDLK